MLRRHAPDPWDRFGYAEEVAGVIERHDDHDHAADDVDRFEARTS